MAQAGAAVERGLDAAQGTVGFAQGTGAVGPHPGDPDLKAARFIRHRPAGIGDPAAGRSDFIHPIGRALGIAGKQGALLGELRQLVLNVAAAAMPVGRIGTVIETALGRCVISLAEPGQTQMSGKRRLGRPDGSVIGGDVAG